MNRQHRLQLAHKQLKSIHQLLKAGNCKDCPYQKICLNLFENTLCETIAEFIE